MIKLFLIFIISINMYANDNKILNDKFEVLKERIEKIEQKNILLQNENIKLSQKIEIKNNSSNLIANSISLMALILSGLVFYTNSRKEKANLKITPVSLHYNNGIRDCSHKYYDSKEEMEYFGIEIINFSNFPININNIRFDLSFPENGFCNKEFQKIIFPIHLKSRDTIMVYFKIKDICNIKPKNVRIRLETGESFTGTSKAFKELIKSF